jgi:hypothetical protein
VIAEPRRGYGRACRTGIQAVAADSEIIEPPRRSTQSVLGRHRMNSGQSLPSPSRKTMMQAADHKFGSEATKPFDWSAYRRILG